MILSRGVLVVLLVAVLLCCVEGWWSRRRRRNRAPAPKTTRKPWGAGVNVDVNNNGAPRLNGKLTYTKDNFQFKGTGSVDASGNWRAGVGASWKWKRNNKPNEVFLLKVEASPCQFRVYDENEDGVVTLEEVNDLFPEDVAEKLFMKLDTTADGLITMEEFLEAPKMIVGLGCDPNAPPVDVLAAEDDDDDVNDVGEDDQLDE